jgi:DNA-binding MarR family transcriptional regulator
MGTSPPNVTQLLDALERDGLVERVINAENRRVTYARLTAKGEAMCAEMVPDMVRFMDETMDGLSKQEKQQLTGLLIRLRHNFDRYLSSDA